jgi:hypothetical protein
MQKDFEIIANVTADIYSNAQRQKINHWLFASDSSTNYRRARHNRYEHTNLWFIKSRAFDEWRENDQLMWLYEKADCDKTVLSFIIIVEIECRRDSDEVTYFYFDFNDIEKQTSKKMIRFIIKQFLAQFVKKCSQLEALFFSCNNEERQSNLNDLMQTLKKMIERYDKTYIILDALDECLNRQNLLKAIEQIQKWKLSQLHMLIISRMLTNIEEVLTSMIESRNRICIQSAAVNSDIEIYVDKRFRSDRRLSRWLKHSKAQKKIKNTLKKKADDM